MKAIVLQRSSDTKIELVALPKPVCQPNEVLIRIKAAALNHRDEWCRKGLYPNIKDGIVLGSDAAGIVEEVGDSENLKAGQIITARQLRDENSLLRRNDLNLVEARDAKPATAEHDDGQLNE